MLTKDEITAFTEHFLAAWNAHDLEQILSHYAEQVELNSPVASEMLKAPEGRIVGKANLRAYFQQALAAYPQLHFTLIEMLWGVQSVVLYYENQRGTHTAEYMELSPQGQVTRVVANYSR